VTAQQGSQVEQQRTGRIERETALPPRTAHQKKPGLGMGRIAVRLEMQAAQRGQTGVKLPGRIQWCDRLHRLLLIHRNAHAAQRKGAIPGGMAQRHGQISVEVFQGGEGLQQAGEQARLGEGVGHGHGHDHSGISHEEIPMLRPLQPHALVTEPDPGLAQAGIRPGGVEGDREDLCQAVGRGVFIPFFQQPQHQAVFGIGVQIEQPAAQLRHAQPACAGAAPPCALPAA